MARWAQPTTQRQQVHLFSPTLDAMIPDDHPVRLFDDLLSLCDWALWENHYCLVHGQPPIHPRIIARVILYGLSRGMRHSRTLEYMLSTNIDFMWLAENRTIDHSTICGFRTKFRHELKQLFKDVFKIAMRAGLANLETVALVAESDWDKLPRNCKSHKLDRAAFVYDEQADCYYCPMGRALPFWRIHNRTGRDGPVKSRVYQCPGGVDCPLASECVAGKTGRRSVAHDDCEHHRRAMDARMASDRGRKTYARRKWIAETPFGIIKAQMGLRQFLLRGLEKVKAEWLWACTAFNLAKLVRNGVAVRAYIATIKG